jgi:hypothetical protein
VDLGTMFKLLLHIFKLEDVISIVGYFYTF